METEIWKDIPGFEGRYQASNLGNIKSLNYARTNKERHLKLINSNGYQNVSMFGRKYFVHILVAKTFLSSNYNNKEVNHINGIRNDNKIDNLEIISHRENITHYYRILGKGYQRIKRKKSNYS